MFDAFKAIFSYMNTSPLKILFSRKTFYYKVTKIYIRLLKKIPNQLYLTELYCYSHLRKLFPNEGVKFLLASCIFKNR